MYEMLFVGRLMCVSRFLICATLHHCIYSLLLKIAVRGTLHYTYAFLLSFFLLLCQSTTRDSICARRAHKCATVYRIRPKRYVSYTQSTTAKGEKEKPLVNYLHDIYKITLQSINVARTRPNSTKAQLRLSQKAR